MDEKTIPLSSFQQNHKKKITGTNKDWDNTLSYRALFEQTGECIFIISLDFHYITANQQALTLLGYQEHELIHKPINEVVTQDSTLVDEVSDNQPVTLQERILKCKDGTRIPVEISTTVVYDDNNEPSYIQSVARDISIRKKTENKLKRNALILSIISQSTAKLLQSTDIDSKIPSLLESLGRAMNAPCCAILSIDSFSENSFAQIRYQWSQFDFSDDEISNSLAPFIPNLLEPGQPDLPIVNLHQKNQDSSGLSFIFLPMDGAFDTHGTLVFFEDVERLPWSASEMDALQTAANLISAALQRKRYEETIRLSEARNRTILDSLPDLLIRVSINGKILDYSAHPDHPLHIDRDLAYGRLLTNTFPEELAAQIIGEDNHDAFISSQTVEEFRLPYAKGVYEARLYPIYANEALIVIRDVTEQVKLNEMKSDFINRASHELRTPLTAAMLMVELIQEGGTPDEMKECWRTLKRELYRQKDLIDNLLMAGRLESGMVVYDVKEIELLPILRESMQSVQPIVAKRNVSLNMTNTESSYKVWGDAGGLQQVFINLINNAAKFSPAGSSVDIKISQTENRVNIAIVDKGVGIPQEAIPHLFERFYRAKNVTIAEIPGSGIGLYIVNSIVQELGGEIKVESVPDKGTTFTICLKRAEVKE